MKFDQVQSRAERLLRREVPIYQVRLVMRFWSVQGLLQHRRARFMAKAPRDLKAESAEFFVELAKQSNPLRRGR